MVLRGRVSKSPATNHQLMRESMAPSLLQPGHHGRRVCEDTPEASGGQGDGERPHGDD